MQDNFESEGKKNNKPPRRASRQHTWGAFLILGHSLLCRCRNLCQEVIQDIQITLKIESGLLIVKPPAGLALVEHIKSLLQRNIQSLRNLHHNAPYALIYRVGQKGTCRNGTSAASPVTCTTQKSLQSRRNTRFKNVKNALGYSKTVVILR